MATYDLGDQVELTIYVTTDAGVASNADTITCTITLPDGTTTVPVETNPATGTYSISYIPTQAGRHKVNWLVESIGSVADEDDAYEDSFDVSDAVGPLVSLDDAKAYLNITTTTDDDELRRFVDVASAQVEAYCQRIFRRQTFTAEKHDGGRSTIHPRHTPILSVTSITENGTALTVDTGYQVTPTGSIRRLSGAYTPSTFTAGAGNVSVTYAAGYADVPDDVTQGCLVLLKHLWESQRTTSITGARRPNTDDYAPGVTFSMPRRVVELLAPYTTMYRVG